MLRTPHPISASSYKKYTHKKKLAPNHQKLSFRCCMSTKNSKFGAWNIWKYLKIHWLKKLRLIFSNTSHEDKTKKKKSDLKKFFPSKPITQRTSLYLLLIMVCLLYMYVNRFGWENFFKFNMLHYIKKISSSHLIFFLLFLHLIHRLKNIYNNFF